MYHRGSHTGSIEFGMTFDDSMFTRFKDAYGVDVAVYLHEGDHSFRSFGSTHGQGPLLDSEGLAQALAGGRPLQHAGLSGQAVSVMGQVLHDFAGEPIGVVEISMDRGIYMAAERSAVTMTAVISLVALAVGVLLTFLVSRTITHPLRRTSHAMRDIAQGEGDLTQRLDDTARDEVGELGKHFNAFVSRMQTTMASVRKSSRSVNREAEEISRDSEKLATSTEQAAANLQQTSSAIEEISSIVQHSSESSEQGEPVGPGGSQGST
jgi:methyl-accepting chemotaxis protein